MLFSLNQKPDMHSCFLCGLEKLNPESSKLNQSDAVLRLISSPQNLDIHSAMCCTGRHSSLILQHFGFLWCFNCPLYLFWSDLADYPATAPQTICAGFGVPNGFLGCPGWDWQPDLGFGAWKTQPVWHHETDCNRYCVTVQFATFCCDPLYFKLSHPQLGPVSHWNGEKKSAC